MQTRDFDYILPEDRIAQKPAFPRDHSRLFVLNRATGERAHRHFFEIGEYLNAGDLLVVNESKVFKARLRGRIGKGSLDFARDDSSVIPSEQSESRNRFPRSIEIFLLHPDGDDWIALAKPAKKIRVGDVIAFDESHTAIVREKIADGTVRLGFRKGDFSTSPGASLEMTEGEVLAWTDRVGEVPLPPYIASRETNEMDYQTVYAKNVGSVAAPTAGFHFTPELIEKLKSHGIKFASVTLHVGLGTFRPMKTETLEEHVMHQEWIDIPDATLQAIQETKAAGHRVIAVGTTTVRTLESQTHHGFTNIFITPGYTFKIVDALITNFHLPKSTLLVLISSFAGREQILDCYREAIEKEYRFYSFGDAMLIV